MGYDNLMIRDRYNTYYYHYLILSTNDIQLK